MTFLSRWTTARTTPSGSPANLNPQDGSALIVSQPVVADDRFGTTTGTTATGGTTAGAKAATGTAAGTTAGSGAEAGTDARSGTAVGSTGTAGASAGKSSRSATATGSDPTTGTATGKKAGHGTVAAATVTAGDAEAPAPPLVTPTGGGTPIVRYYLPKHATGGATGHTNSLGIAAGCSNRRSRTAKRSFSRGYAAGMKRASGPSHSTTPRTTSTISGGPHRAGSAVGSTTSTGTVVTPREDEELLLLVGAL